MKDNDKKFILPALLLLVIVAVVLIWRFKSISGESIVSPEPIGAEKPIVSEETSKNGTLSKEEFNTSQTAEIANAPTQKQAGVKPEKTPFDPENQPRKFFVQDFTNLGNLPAGFKLDNLIITDKGIELPKPEAGQEDKPRSGMIESPPELMDFPSNAVSPLWKSDEPEGTTVLVEVSLSPDGQNWGMWHQIMIDDDAVGQISEFYPDGSPNPNYGYTPGGVLCWGLRQYQYFRYRVTLYSESKDSPILSSVRLFYQDSTLGEGHIAELNELGNNSENPNNPDNSQNP